MSRIGWIEKWTLRYAVSAILFLALAGFEGMLMRAQLLSPGSLSGMEAVLANIRPGGAGATSEEIFYAMLTAHPVVGIYGFAYLAVMGAFYFLVPMLLKTEIRHKSLVPVNFWLQIAGVLIAWGAGFFGMFNALYTLYWPLPVSYDRVPLVGSIIFTVGAALIMVNILLFAFNLFSTVLHKSNSHNLSFKGFLSAAFGIPMLLRRLGRKTSDATAVNYDELPVFIVAIARGSIDTVINAIVLLTAGALILVYGLAALGGRPFDPNSVNALAYKNWFWWGLDMVADGNVLMYTAGTWYLLVPILTGRRLYGESVVRVVILADLLVSMFVWSHHLMGDTQQPMALKLFSGQFVTWGEYFTMGLTIFSVMMTIWQARPVKITPPLKFVLGSIFGFTVGGMAGLTQANVGLSVVLHNTQWVIGTHAHVMLLGGLSMLLFAVIYALIPMLTKLEIRSPQLVNLHFWSWLPGAIIMGYAMGWAGTQGMLRRTIYTTTQYQPEMIVAMLGGVLMSIGFLAFLANLIVTLGWQNVIGLVVPEGWLRGRLQPAQA